MGLDECEQGGVELGGLGEQEPDPGGYRAQGQDRDPVLDVGAGRAVQLVDAIELLGRVRPRNCARRCSGATTIRLLSSLIALVRLTRTACRVTVSWRSASRRPRSRGAACSCWANAV